jgi:CO/xanthine dehydrogenase Mo-binding subunit
VVTVTPENRVTAALTRLESGQGITTLMAMLLAEELDARLIDVDIPLADADATRSVDIGDRIELSVGASLHQTLGVPAGAFPAGDRS